ncbi:MAG: NAD(P)-dependent oxidoreductase [Bacteroidales bacterium]|nr:NAD(P)-dependent oxidoreductase [Bacteroidales bacterium]
MKLGVLRETKIQPDKRVAITPHVAKKIIEQYPDIHMLIQSSDIRAFKDEEYLEKNIPVSNDISDCDVLIGIKEVAKETLIPNKTYLFFSHTAKKQPYNRAMLQKCAELGITLIDYEFITDDHHVRLIAFGRWAGIVGAYNTIYTYGIKTGLFTIKRAFECFDHHELFQQLEHVKLPPIKILVTGGGRVANGALETLSHLNIKQISPEDFLTKSYHEPVFARLDPWHYVKHKNDIPFNFEHFTKYPEEYVSTFLPYALKTDVYIPCHYWDPKSPVFLKPEDYLLPEFHIQVIGDVSCDIGKPIASTLRASTIANPIYGYNPHTQKEDDPLKPGNVAVMAIDNLPAELPRSSSEDFANTFANKIIPELIKTESDVIKRATILYKGTLTTHFEYLRNYLEGKE